MSKTTARTRKKVAYRPTQDEREAIGAQFTEDKQAGLKFKEAFAKLNDARDKDKQLSEGTAYS